MKIFGYKIRRSVFPVLYLLFAALLFTGCNQDGVGIFYQISQEEAQKESKIADLPVYQAVEVGSNLYVLAGRSIYRKSEDDWSKISSDNYVYDIVKSGGTLYANINNDDNNLDDAALWRYTGSWTKIKDYNTNVKLFTAEGGAADGYFLKKGIGGVDSVESGSAPDTMTVTHADITSLPVDAASDGTDDLLITGDTIFGSDYSNPMAALADPSGKSGDYTGLSTDGTLLLLTTSKGQLFSSDDGGSSWTMVEDTDGNIGSAPVQASLAVVSLGGTDYLIIGTENGYYEWEIGTADASGPTATADTDDSSGFSATYPDLATSLVYCVLPSALNSNVFYLGTDNGLWRRNSDGSFERL